MTPRSIPPRKSLPPAAPSPVATAAAPEGNRALRRARMRAERAGDAALLARLDAEAAALTATSVPTMPVHVQIREGRIVAAFLDRHRDPVVDPATGAVQRPGLSSLGATFNVGVAVEIRALCDALEGDRAARAVTAPPVVGPTAARAYTVLREVDQALGWRDGQRAPDARDAELARVRAVPVREGSAESVALGLEARCALAEACRTELHGVGGFDAARIDEGLALVDALREAPVSAADARSADARDGLRTLLARRVERAREAAAFVFRAHPRVAQGARSAWDDARNRKARAARAKKKAQPPTPPAPPTPPNG